MSDGPHAIIRVTGERRLERLREVRRREPNRNAHGEGEDGGQVEHRMLGQHAQAQLHVQPREAELREGLQPHGLTRLCPMRTLVPELAPRTLPRDFWREPLAHQRVGALRDVVLELLAHVALQLVAVQHAAVQRARAREHAPHRLPIRHAEHVSAPLAGGCATASRSRTRPRANAPRR